MPKKRSPAGQPVLFPLRREQVIYCGDCLDQLPNIPNESVDLVYIDPPFNSNRNYEVFWGEAKERRAFEDRHASTQAYIDYMRPRCTELARVLKKTGSFYYHCDWHASHYAKVMLDEIFGENQFQNEIVWKRSSAHSDTKQGMSQYGRIYDSIFFYSAGDHWTFNSQFQPYGQDYVSAKYTYTDPDGRLFKSTDLTAAKPGGDTEYDWHGKRPPSGRYWAYSKANMEKLESEGKLHYTKTGFPRLKHYLDEMRGVPLQNIWLDIPPINSQANERIGYPTQKPLPLLERIVQVSSNAGDLVLDAFCGCGTALVAAENLDRRWIGIDISPTACRVVGERVQDVCKIREGADFVIRNLPRKEGDLRTMPPFEFESWAVIALGGNPNRAKVGDLGIDGKIFPVASAPVSGKQAGEFGFMDTWYPVQVKQKDKAGRQDIDAFETAMERANRTKGFFVSFDFTSDAMTEISRFFKKTGKVIVPITVREILDDQIAAKLV